MQLAYIPATVPPAPMPQPKPDPFGGDHAYTRSPSFDPSIGWAAALGGPCRDEGMPDKHKGASISKGNRQEEKHTVFNVEHPSIWQPRHVQHFRCWCTVNGAIGVPSLPPLANSSLP
jgi:hypothetical protein